MFNRKLYVKERFDILENEMNLGIQEAKFHAQTLAYIYGAAFQEPGALTFYNALNFPDPRPCLSWVDNLPDVMSLVDVSCDMPCNECAHRMLVLACYSECSDERTAAYLMTAYDTLEDSVLKDRVKKVVDRLVESEDFLLALAEEVLYAVDSVLSTPVTESESVI